MDTVADFIFLGSKITADGDLSHEIKRYLLLGRKVMTNLDSILESRDITLPTKVHLVEAMVFPIVTDGCEGWTRKKAERRRIEKVGLKLNIQKTKIMASGPITSWEIHGETVETVADFMFLGSKVTADGDCSHEIKRHLLLGRKVYDQPRQHIKKQRHYFANKGPSSQSYAFSSSHVWMCELGYKES